MEKMRIRFQSPEEVVSFVNQVERYPYHMDIAKGSYLVDAKSIMGIIGVGIGNVMELTVYEENCQELQKKLEKYRAA